MLYESSYELGTVESLTRFTSHGLQTLQLILSIICSCFNNLGE